MKLIIASGRDFEDKVLALKSFMVLIAEVNYGYNSTAIPTNTITEQNNDTKSIVVRENPFTEIVISHTECDCHIGEFVANFYKIPVKRFISDWDTLGKRAGYVRNLEMVEYADALLVFWDGQSRCTEHVINIAKQKGLLVKVVNY